LILGAGIAGLIAASELQQMGTEVLVIDKGHGVGGGVLYALSRTASPCGNGPRHLVHASVIQPGPGRGSSAARQLL
jgi:protoporphyrinogen oxidase